MEQATTILSAAWTEITSELLIYGVFTLLISFDLVL